MYEQPRSIDINFAYYVYNSIEKQQKLEIDWTSVPLYSPCSLPYRTADRPDGSDDEEEEETES